MRGNSSLLKSVLKHRQYVICLYIGSSAEGERMMRRALVFIILAMSILLPFTAAAEGTVPDAAAVIASSIDQQILKKIGTHPQGRNSVSIAVTVPVSLTDLNKSSPLGRQMAAEITTLLVEKGYVVDDIRKGKDIIMEEGVGEMLLTRKLNQLARRDVHTAAVLVGTYTVTSESVRFNIQLLHTPTNQILATGAATVPVTPEVFPLLADKTKRPPQPSVMTRLN